jgi:energy-coupling factor transport system substrate-specific component
MTAPSWLRRFTLANLAFLLMNLVGLAFFLYPFWAPVIPAASQSRAALLLFSGAAGLALLALIAEAQQGLTLHTIAILGALVGLNTVLRVIDNVVPLPGGFSPVYLLIILVGYTLGSRLGFMMGALTMLVSGPLTAGGIGPWTPYQMMAAGWVGLGAAWLPHTRGQLWTLGVYGAAWGWAYGALTNLYFWPYAIQAPDLAWQPGLDALQTLARYGRFYLVTSLAWDTTAAIGNVVLLALLGGPLLKVLERFQRRAHVVWETVEPGPQV